MKQVHLFLAMLVMLSSGWAQGNWVLSGMDWVPQSSEIQPHKRPVGNGFLIFPGVNAQWSTDWLQPAQWLETDAGITTLNINSLLASTNDVNAMNVHASVDLIGFGFDLGRRSQHFISFSISETMNASLALPGDLIRLPFLGNAGLPNGIMNGDALGFDAAHIRSYSLGWQGPITERLAAGVRLRHLRGMECLSLQDVRLRWNTDPETLLWTVEAAAAIQSAGLRNALDTIAGNSALEQGLEPYLREAGDPGWGWDLGAEYALNEQWKLSASFVGSGKIQWSREVRSAQWQSDALQFDGVELEGWVVETQVLQDSLSSLLQGWSSWVDDLKNPDENDLAFEQTLQARWNVRIERNLGDRAAFACALLGNGADLTGLASLTWEAGQTMQANVTYGRGPQFNSLGAGVACRLGGLLWFLAVDNILAAQYVRIDSGEDRSFVLPWDASMIHGRTGVAWVIGRPKKTTKAPSSPPVSPSSRWPGL